MDSKESKNLDQPENVEGESGALEEIVEENVGETEVEHEGETAGENVGETAGENVGETAAGNIETLKETQEEAPKEDVGPSVPEESANEKTEDESDEDDSEEEEDDSSESSEDSSNITKEMKDMYEESDESEEEEEEGEEKEEEEGEEEEKIDLQEYKELLESKYMEDSHWDKEYLDTVNRTIEEVPEQLYAIEIYVTDVKTFFGYNRHWVRIKAFDSPCFEIHPCQKVQTHASLYANRSTKESKETLDIMEMKQKSTVNEKRASKQEPKKKELKRMVIDLSTMSEMERRSTIKDLMREELTSPKTDLWSKNNLKIDSKQKCVGYNFPSEDVDSNLFSAGDKFPQKVWILKEPFENGKTIMFPMRPQQLIHQIQRQPLKVFVLSSSGRQCCTSLSLSGLLEAVVRASKGPPYPISSSQKFNITADGEFISKITGIIKITAMGRQDISQARCADNPNQLSNHYHRKDITRISKNTDCQDKPAILTGPKDITLYDIVKNIRARRQARKYKLPPEPKKWKYYVDDLIFDRKANTVVRAPKKTFETLRAEIDRYLVLNRPKKEIPEFSEDSSEDVWTSECPKSGEEELEYFHEEEVEEEEEEEEEEMEEDSDNDIDTSTHRIEAVFQSLFQHYNSRSPASEHSSRSADDSLTDSR